MAASRALLLHFCECRACSRDYSARRECSRSWCLSPLLCLPSPEPQDTPSRVTHALGPRILFQPCPLSTEVLCLCMPRSYSYALQQMLYGSCVISTLQHYARGTDLISCSLSWQGMGALLRQCAKPQMGREKEQFFHCSAVALTANDDGILCSYAFHLRISECSAGMKQDILSPSAAASMGNRGISPSITSGPQHSSCPARHSRISQYFGMDSSAFS